MELVCDLEIHSKYARAVSKDMVVPEMAKWASRKGIDVLGTGDFTHPVWLAELEQHLKEDGKGLLQVRQGGREANNIRFMLTGEVSLIYSQGGSGRRVHIIIVAPSFEIVKAINAKLAPSGTLSSDGRPVLGLSAKWLLEYILEINQKFGLNDKTGAFLIPAHVWTPWFGLYGSKSGFDSLEECFEELTPHIHTIETGLSSDPPMNWRLSKNDNVAITSFSDAHSAPNLMREATIVNVKEKTYKNIAEALQNPTTRGENKIDYTLEFFPEEGKYHYDGIADQNLRLAPAETAKLLETNPALAKKVTVGVLSRVEDLADRQEDYKPTNRPLYKSAIPLQEIIADLYGVGKQSQKVQAEYERIVNLKNEFDVLVRASERELIPILGQELANAVLAVRRGEVEIEPGYDGVFGKISVKKSDSGPAQESLF